MKESEGRTMNLTRGPCLSATEEARGHSAVTAREGNGCMASHVGLRADVGRSQEKGESGLELGCSGQIQGREGKNPFSFSKLVFQTNFEYKFKSI